MSSNSTPRSTNGVLEMVLSALFFSVMSLLVKLVGERISTAQIVLARSLVSLVLSWWLLKRLKIDWRGNRPPLLILRGFFGLGGLLCYFSAISQLTLSDVTVLHYTNPIFTALIAALCLGEKITRRHGIALFICVFGVVLVARPSILFGSENSLPVDGVAIALLGAVLAAAAYVTVRKLGKSEHPLVVVLYFPLVSVPLVLPIALLDWVMPTPQEWLLLLGVGLTTQFAQVFMTRGLHKLPAGRATAIGYLQIVFATGWGWLVYQSFPDAIGIAGALLIVGGVLLTKGSATKEPSSNRGGVVDS